MTHLVLIDTRTRQMRRIAERAIGPAFHLDPDATPAELRQDIEQLRAQGAPVPTPGEQAFDGLAGCLAQYGEI